MGSEAEPSVTPLSVSAMNTSAPAASAAAFAAIAAATPSVGIMVPKLPGGTSVGAFSLTTPMTAYLTSPYLKIS